MGDIELTTFISHLLIYMVVLVFAISAHECGHAWMSKQFGDDTAYMLGRVTLNPVSHTDILGTLILPAMSFVFGAMGGVLGSIPLIGWGKPTPVEPRNWTNYRVANFWVSIAGILANLTIAVIAFVIYKVLLKNGVLASQDYAAILQPIELFLRYSLFLNVSLAIFNLLPIPPLDGGKILANFMPESVEGFFDAIEPFGFIILMFLIMSGVLAAIMVPVSMFVRYLLVL